MGLPGLSFSSPSSATSGAPITSGQTTGTVTFGAVNVASPGAGLSPLLIIGAILLALYFYGRK